MKPQAIEHRGQENKFNKTGSRPGTISRSVRVAGIFAAALFGVAPARAGDLFPCAEDNACDNHVVATCAAGTNAGRVCLTDADCGGYACRPTWEEYFIDAGQEFTCAAQGFGGDGADGVDIRDFDGDGDWDIVTGWEETGITFVYQNPCNPSNPADPTDCTNAGGVRQVWQVPWGTNPMDVRGGAGTEDIEDAVFADFDLDGRPDGVVTATEGGNKHVKIHGLTHQGTWLGQSLPGEKHLYMQVRVADINGDGCADIVAGNKIAHPTTTVIPPVAGCYTPWRPEGQRCNDCDDIGATCDEVGGIWWWECPKINGACAPFGPHFGDTPPRIDTSDWTKRRIDSGFYWIMGLDLVDMDGDGDKDVLYSDRFEVGWFRNRTDEGNLAGWNAPIRIDTEQAVRDRKDGAGYSSGEPFRFHAYGRVDEDDLEDVVVTASFTKGFCNVNRDVVCRTDAGCPAGDTCVNNGDRFAGYFYRRLNAAGTLWDINPILVKGGLPYGLDFKDDKVSKGVAIGDVTGDGRLDLVFSVRGKGHALYMLTYDPAPEQCGPCVNHEWNAIPIAPCRKLSKYDNVRLADLDRDGRLDVISSEENFAPGDTLEEAAGLGVVWYRNLGFCGNGLVDEGEACDNGARNGDPTQCCAIDCTLKTGQVCRPGSGVCTKTEFCQADSAECPADENKPAGLFCQNSFCDAVRHECDGVGNCVANDPIPCTQNSDCDSGLCLPVQNVCAGACEDDGNDCTHDVCNSGGSCTHPPKAPDVLCGTGREDCQVSKCDGASVCRTRFTEAGYPCGPNPTEPCDEYDECNGTGTCVPKIRPAGAICRWSAGDCDFEEICDGVHTSCPLDLFMPPGTVCADPPPRSCNGDESICYGYCSEYQCDANRDCALVGIDAGRICYDDGNECSVHTCTATWCIRQDFGSGTPCADDGISCTLDWCNGITCTHTPDPIEQPCEDDGNPCTDDVCDTLTGECAHIPVPGRLCDDDGDPCTEDVCGEFGECHTPAPDQTPCADDGSVCTQDFCVAGVCFHPPVDQPTGCDDDANECTDDVCVTGECQHIARVGQACADEGNDCTIDVCDDTGACTHPAVADRQACADDGRFCTEDICTSGACTHPSKEAGVACGNPTAIECDAADTCDGAGNCAANFAADATPCTPDQLACTIDECRSGVCVHAAELPLPPFSEENPADPLCGGHALLPVGDPPNDIIRAFTIFDDGGGEALYAGGAMLHKWDGASWTQIGGPGGIADTILSLEVASDLPYGSGPALYVGGSLVAPLDGPQPLLRWDGTTWMEVGSFDGPIHAMEAVGGTLYVGGAFTTVDYADFTGPVNGLVVNHIARLTQMDLEFDPPNVIVSWEALGVGTDDDVYALAWGLYSCSPFDRLGVGGAFTTAGGLPATGFAHWDLNGAGWGTPDPLLPPDGGTIPVVHTVAAIKPPYDFVRPFHIGGLFRAPASDSPTGYSTNVARLLGCGGNWYGTDAGGAGVTSGGLHAVLSIAPAVDASGPATFIGGEFETFNDVVAPQVTRVANWTHSLGSCLNGSVQAMMAFDDGGGEALYVGGQFTNGSGEHFVARWRSLPGDLNGDGIVTVADFTFSNDWSNGMLWCLAGPNQWREGCCDLNKDRHVDLRDVAELMNLMGTTN